MSKVLVIYASPRLYSNGEIFAASFIEGAEKVGHEIDKLHLNEFEIKPCRACDRCYSTGRPCIMTDDMNMLYPRILAADIVVIVSPLYYFGFPAQLKAMIDRLYALDIRGKLSQKSESKMGQYRKGCALLMTAADKNVQVFDIVKQHYQKIFIEWFQWQDLGMLLAGGIIAPGDISDNPILTEARRLGEKI